MIRWQKKDGSKHSNCIDLRCNGPLEAYDHGQLFESYLTVSLQGGCTKSTSCILQPSVASVIGDFGLKREPYQALCSFSACQHARRSRQAIFWSLHLSALVVAYFTWVSCEHIQISTSQLCTTLVLQAGRSKESSQSSSAGHKARQGGMP